MLAFSFFAAIFSSFLWLIYSLAYINDNTIGVRFSSLGIVDISIYVALVVLPVLVLWMVFGYINQHINNQKTSKALYQIFLQLKKNQDYTDLVARIMLESEQQIKDGFILSRIDILISDMNELIAEIISRAALASREQIESLWLKVKSGGKWALGKVIIEINQNQPNFQMRLYEKSQNDLVLAGTILEFCSRYQNTISLLSKHDSERVFLSVVENGVFGKVFTILAPLADEIRKFRETSFTHSEQSLNFSAPSSHSDAPKSTPTQNSAPSENVLPQVEKKNILKDGLAKLSSFIKKEKNEKSFDSEPLSRDPFSIALERSFGSSADDNIVENKASFSSSEDITPKISLPSENTEENNPNDIIIDFPQEDIALDIKPEPINVPISNTQKTLNDLKKEWEDMKKSSSEIIEEDTKNGSQKETTSSDETLIFPFGGWTDESNYHK